MAVAGAGLSRLGLDNEKEGVSGGDKPLAANTDTGTLQMPKMALADWEATLPALQAVLDNSDIIQPFQSRLQRIQGNLEHDGMTLETMMVGSGGRGELEQKAYRKMVDTGNYRSATHEENALNATNLLAKEKNGTLTPEDVEALAVYRSRRVDDATGYVEIDNNEVQSTRAIQQRWRLPGGGYTSVTANRRDRHYPGEIDALMVRATQESQTRPETQTLKTVEGMVTSGDFQLGTMLADWDTDASSAKDEHGKLMARMNFRTATRSENYDNADGLISREKEGTLTAEDTRALEIYRKRPVEDSEGSLTIHGDKIVETNNLPVLDHQGLPRDSKDSYRQVYPDTLRALGVRTIDVKP